MKPALTDLLASARVVSLPLRTKFRGVVDREVMLFEGPNGWAEWSPFLEYPDEEAAVWLSAAIEFAYGSMPTLHRDRIAVNATLPAVAPDQVATVLARFGSFSTVKIKVAEPGQTPGQDVDRIIEVRKLYPDAQLPRFTVEEHTPQRLILVYDSPRHFEDLAEGLMQGCMAHFGERADLSRSALQENGVQRERFVLTRTT